MAENAQPALSQQFIQYLLSPEVQTIQAQAIGLGPVNKTVQADAGRRGARAVWS